MSVLIVSAERAPKMNKKTIWIIDDIPASARVVRDCLLKFEDKARVFHVFPGRFFKIPHPSTLWCKRDGDVTPDIVISELISGEELGRLSPQFLFEQLTGTPFKGKTNHIQRLTSFAEEHKVKHVAVVSRCIDWFSNHRDLTPEEANGLNTALREKLIASGIITLIAKKHWTAQKEKLDDFIEKALVS